MSNLAKLITKAPTTPGVYKFLNDKKVPLYVGKAKNLKKRLQSYVRKSAKHSKKTVKMLEQAESVEWIETNSEIEALILEGNMVYTLQPRYNVLLKDDKAFQYIKVSIQDDYPTVSTVRRITKDGAKYFGPKTSGTDVFHLMEAVKRIFKLCSRKNIQLDLKGSPLKGAKLAVKVGGSKSKRPCLDYHIKRCTGPCAGMVTPEEYREQIDQAVEFLSGKYQSAIAALKEQMKAYAAARKFERAASMRDQIKAIERSAQKQLITDTKLPDRDVIAFVEDLGKNYFVLFQIRTGKLIAQEKFIAEGGESPHEVMEAFLTEYYGLAADIPKEVVISVTVPSAKLMETFIRKHTDHAVKLIRPQAGKKDDLILLAEKNARSFADASRAKWEVDEKRGEKALKELKEALNLSDIPKRMECFDISHISGAETVGSMSVFKKGKPYKADYRMFRLRTTQGSSDDFRSIDEVITRRLNYLPAKLPKGYKLRKAKKADFEFIVKTVETEAINNSDLDVKQFYVIEKGKNLVAFGRMHKLDEKVDDLSTLWVSPKERGQKLGYFLIKKLIESSKQKRIYLDTVKSLEDYYLKLGFEVIHKPQQAVLDKIEKVRKSPKQVKKARKAHGEKIEIVYMAYQKRKADRSFTSWPDLIVIDGGKGQLSFAHEVMKGKGIDIPMISLAKKQEEVFVPGVSVPINLKKDSEGSYLLQRIRDEAHRFAIEYNRGSRDKKMTQSVLDKISGVGPKLKKRLLSHFGSVAKIREASHVQLESIAGEAMAKKIKENL